MVVLVDISIIKVFLSYEHLLFNESLTENPFLLM